MFQDQGFTLFHSGFATDAHTQHVEEGRWVGSMEGSTSRFSGMSISSQVEFVLPGEINPDSFLRAFRWQRMKTI